MTEATKIAEELAGARLTILTIEVNQIPQEAKTGEVLAKPDRPRRRKFKRQASTRHG